MQWEDILMRIEMPNRTPRRDMSVQNSTNNLINRSENNELCMLAWFSTGTRGVRNNVVRTSVLQRLAAAQPPPPPNSTRGLTPGLINPALGNIRGNSIPFPRRRPDQGKLRVGIVRRSRAQAAAAANPVAANSNQAGTKRRRSSRKHKGRPSKRRRLTDEDSTEDDSNEEDSTGEDSTGEDSTGEDSTGEDSVEDDNTSTESDETKSSEVCIGFLNSCGSC